MKGKVPAPSTTAKDSEKLGGVSSEEYEKLLALGVTKIRCGTASLDVDANGSGSVAVVFSETANRAPSAAVATILSASPLYKGVGVNNLTASGFDVFFQNATEYKSNMWAYWIAIWL